MSRLTVWDVSFHDEAIALIAWSSLSYHRLGGPRDYLRGCYFFEGSFRATCLILRLDVPLKLSDESGHGLSDIGVVMR